MTGKAELVIIGLIISLLIFFGIYSNRIPHVKGWTSVPLDGRAWHFCAAMKENDKDGPPWHGKVYVDDVLFSCSDIMAGTQVTRIGTLLPGESVSIDAESK